MGNLFRPRVPEGVLGLSAPAFGFLAPAGTPKEVVSRLNAEFNAALKQPDLQKKLGDQGADPAGGTADQFAALIKDDIVRWGKVVKQSGARID